MDNQMSEKEKRAYVSLYKKNTTPYSLVLLAIVTELIYVVTVLDVMTVSYLMGVTVMVNIVIIFVLFTCAMRVNVYDRFWAFAALLLGCYMVLRVAAIVPFVLKPYGKQTLLTIVNTISAVLLLTAGLISIKNIDVRQKLQEKIGRAK